MTLPEMSVEDRTKALDSAKAARSQRAKILSQVTKGELSVIDVINMAKDDECASRIKVSALLKAIPGYGDVRVEKLMRELHIAESRRLRGIGPRQRAALIAYFVEKSKKK